MPDARRLSARTGRNGPGWRGGRLLPTATARAARRLGGRPADPCRDPGIFQRMRWSSRPPSGIDGGQVDVDLVVGNEAIADPEEVDRGNGDGLAVMAGVGDVELLDDHVVG